MATKPDIKQHNARVRQNITGDPLPTEVEINGQYGSSLYADWIREMDFVSIRAVYISLHAPKNWRDWNKVEKEASVIQTLKDLDCGTDFEVWIKTATLGGRSKMYTRPLHDQPHL